MAGVLNTVLQMIEEGAEHLGVATDHVIESFRNGLWSGYKTGEGVEPALLAQFHPLEDALAAMGVAVWPMTDLEADDAMASAAAIAARDSRVQKVCVWTPDKDLAQCVRGERVVQVDRKSKAIRDAAAVRAKFGVPPELIPDYLALVGDSADGYPGIAGIGAKGAASLLSRYGKIEDFPDEVLGERRQLALLFKRLATCAPMRRSSSVWRSSPGRGRPQHSLLSPRASAMRGCLGAPRRRGSFEWAGMAHVFEPAASGRSKCRACGQALRRGELRFGERLPNLFGEGDMTLWFHPRCAAYKRPQPFLQALDATALAIPERAALEPSRDRAPRIGACRASTERIVHPRARPVAATAASRSSAPAGASGWCSTKRGASFRADSCISHAASLTSKPAKCSSGCST